MLRCTPCMVASTVLRGPRALASRARVRSSSAASEPVGLGYCSNDIEDASRATVLAIMLNHIDAPQRFWPVSSIFVQPAQGEAGDDGALWRSMKFDGDGPSQGTTIVQHIYANPAKGEIRFIGLGEDGSESEVEVVNKLLTRPLRIEYFQRHRETLERIHWDAPIASTMRAIETTITMAKSKQAQMCDPNFVASKA